jgi:hypothetical protein
MMRSVTIDELAGFRGTLELCIRVLMSQHTIQLTYGTETEKTLSTLASLYVGQIKVAKAR